MQNTTAPISRPTVRLVAKEVATHLGEGWSSRNGHLLDASDAFLSGPEGAEVRIWLPCKSNPRWEVFGLFGDAHSHLPYGDSGRYVIGMAASKTPERMAAEIRRRLLPDYLPALARAVKAKREHDARFADREDLTDRLLKLLDGARRSYATHQGDFGDYHCGGKVRVISEDVEFAVRVPHALAEDLARAMADLLPVRGAVWR